MEEWLINYFADMNWEPAIHKSLTILVIILLGYATLVIRKKIIYQAFSVTHKLNENKKQSLISMLMSLTRYVVYIVGVILILKQFMDITPIIASAGIVGVAIGFGAQSLVKDVITGFFIMFEDQFHVGDWVEINGGEVTGTIEEIGLRLTTVREWSGKKFYLANSEIRSVRNYNRKELRAIVTVTFPFEEDPVRLRRMLEDVCKQVQGDFHEHMLLDSEGNIKEPLQVYGVSDIDNNDKGGTFTIIGQTKPSSVWTIEKMLKEYIWRNSYQQGIKIAYPRRVYQEATEEEAVKEPGL
ncbi:mechanosensitive ion channel family protein [Peptococcaceae bacterium 1198_IL3148]